MLFLLIRLLPFLIPVSFFAAVDAMFYFRDQWWYFAVLIFLFSILYFGLLKFHNRRKPVFALAANGLIFAYVGLAFSLILEQPLVIYAFLISWSFVYWLYLEAIFHDFYETDKQHVLNLKNVTLISTILVVFFLTASLSSFNLFLSLDWLLMMFIAGCCFYTVFYATIFRQKQEALTARIYAGVLTLILLEIFAAATYLPCSIYVIASIVTSCYYVSASLIVLKLQNQLNRAAIIRIVVLSIALLTAILATANWL